MIEQKLANLPALYLGANGSQNGHNGQHGQHGQNGQNGQQGGSKFQRELSVGVSFCPE